VLVDHPDAKVIGIIGAVYGNFLAPDFNLPLIGMVQTEKDAHQGRLSRTILSEDSMNFPLLYLQGDIVIGDNTGKLLTDV
jgi:hypothetical protein